MPKQRPETLETEGRTCSAAFTSCCIPGMSLSTSSTRNARNERAIERAPASPGMSCASHETKTMRPSKTANESVKKPPGRECSPTATTRMSSSTV